MDLPLDVEWPVSISFGKAELPMKDILKLTTGSIVELNRAINDPVEVLVNHSPIRARRGGGGRQLRRAHPADCRPQRPFREPAMNPLVALAALLSALALASLCLGFFVLYRAASLVASAERRACAGREQCEAATRAIRETVEGLAAEVREVQQQASPQAPACPRPGFNLNKRSQALRMHRRGETREQIALSLGIPLREVDLSIKVHRIVLAGV